MSDDWYPAHRLKNYPLPMVRVVCDKCGRRGALRKERLLAEHGNVKLPALLHLISKCPRADNLRDRCGSYYEDINAPNVQAALDRAYNAERRSIGARPSK